MLVKLGKFWVPAPSQSRLAARPGSLNELTKLTYDTWNTVVSELLVQEAIAAARGQDQPVGWSPDDLSGGVVRTLATTLILKLRPDLDSTKPGNVMAGRFAVYKCNRALGSIHFGRN